jgi:pseudouridine-5'-phosphate glycosidase
VAVVALESTVFAHGLPHPEGLETALKLEAIVRASGAEPKTIGIIGGTPVVGLSKEQIEGLATGADVQKASVRDLPIVVARGRDAATTVATTVTLAHQHGIEVVCTGGIGGVHRGNTSDVSNDLEVLASTPVTVVCSGAKAILDLPATREYLETSGVAVVGYQTDDFPGFYSSTTGLPVDVRCEDPSEVANIIRARREFGLNNATVVCVPVPAEYEIPSLELEPVIQKAVLEAEQSGITGSGLTPFLLSAVAAHTQGRSLDANVALLCNNARLAGEIAVQIT